MQGLLDKIDSPADLRPLGTHGLTMLCREIREVIRRTVGRTGGHLASNLGVVELTVALHKVFDFSADRLILDVGHQCYAHKLLTGRRRAFHTLRQDGGLSGYPSPQESPYDPFVCGHAGTALSTALGLALADGLAGRRRHVVALVGDGAMASGPSLEALNHAGIIDRPLLVVLNDNSMSIDVSVGAMARYLARIRLAPGYDRVKNKIRALVRQIPLVGPLLKRGISLLKEGLKGALVHGHMFEQLGFRYVGPIRGHHIPTLISVLREVKEARHPVLLHVVTTKGRGFAAAQSDPTAFHSAPPFTLANGKVKTEPRSGRTFTRAFSDALLDAAARDRRIVAITAAMPDGTGLVRFRQRFGDRYHNVGICESHAVAVAAGLARGGYKPVVAIYSTFLQRAYDQLFHEISLQGTPAVLAVDRAGLVGPDGPTHHGTADLAYLRQWPGIEILAPADAAEMAAALDYALRQDTAVAIRYPRDRVPPPVGPPRPFERGRGVLLRAGPDGCILALGATVAPALAAADLLAGRDVFVSVVNARFVKPLDAGLICDQASRKGFLLIAEDHSLIGGFSAAVMELLADRGVAVGRVKRLGIPDRFVRHAPRAVLLRGLHLDAEGLAAEAASLAARRIETPTHPIVR
jgi:1-deoxy-D-xylulose-5-phosphate synthase